MRKSNTGLLLRAPCIMRYHTVAPFVKSQTLAEHVYNMLAIVEILKERTFLNSDFQNYIGTPELTTLIMKHDMLEAVYGDTPKTVSQPPKGCPLENAENKNLVKLVKWIDIVEFLYHIRAYSTDKDRTEAIFFNVRDVLGKADTIGVLLPEAYTVEVVKFLEDELLRGVSCAH